MEQANSVRDYRQAPMSQDAELLSKIYHLVRGDLDRAVFPAPDIGRLLDSMEYVRVSRVSAFWKHGDLDERWQLAQSVCDWVSGLYGQGCPWTFLLRGSGANIECWFGGSAGEIDRESFVSTLLAALPDARFRTDLDLDRSSISALRHAVVLTGTPSSRVEQKDRSGAADQVEKVCRGLLGANWAYLIYARPLPASDITQHINQVSQEIRDVHATFLLKAAAADERNRLALRYVELLEAKLKRLEEGRSLGMWDMYPLLLTSHPNLLGRAQGLLHSAFAGPDSLPDPIRARICSPSSAENPSLEPRTSREAAVLARPPWEDYPGYAVIDFARFGLDADPPPARSSAILVGDIMDRGRKTGNALRLDARDLAKHALIVGVTGSGKTNTCFALLDQLWNSGKGTPFLVIESAKAEYRTLLKKRGFTGLNVFTVGDESCSPLRLNPFEVPEGVLVQSHIDYLKSLFAAAFVLYPPMPYVLEQSIQEIYEDRGWDLAQNVNRRGRNSSRRFPTLADLATKVKTVIERMGYDERITMDVTAGLTARIDQLRLGGGKGLMFDTRRSIDPEFLFSTPCLIELKHIVSDDEKAFLMGLILIRLYEFYEAGPKGSTDQLRHVTLIEEAHRLLRNVSTEQGSEVTANPKGRAIEVFANILSEIRAYGEGIFIAEQIPVKLTPDAIKNTNLKIVHRLVAEDDRKVVGATMNLTEAQERYLATLRTGEAVAYTEGAQKPLLLTIPLSPSKSEGINISSADVQQAMSVFWKRNRGLRLRYAACNDCGSGGDNCASNLPARSRSDTLSQEAFLRLWNTLRLNKALVSEAFLDFQRWLERGPRTSQRANAPFCTFVQMVDAEVERQGEFWGWTYEDVERVIDLSCSIVGRIAATVRSVERKALEASIARDLATLSNLLKRLHKVSTLPYPGCRFCELPCHYRFAMNTDVPGVLARDFRAAFFDLNLSVDAVGRVCLDASSRVFVATDNRSKQGAALCFGVQQFSELGLSTSNQEEMAGRLLDSLRKV
jgi:hypothetical protein